MFKFTCIVSQASLVAAMTSAKDQDDMFVSLASLVAPLRSAKDQDYMHSETSTSSSTSSLSSQPQTIMDCYNDKKTQESWQLKTSCVGENRTPAELKEAMDQLSLEITQEQKLTRVAKEKEATPLQIFKQTVEGAFREINKEFSEAFSKGGSASREFTSQEFILQRNLAAKFRSQMSFDEYGHGEITYYDNYAGQWDPKTVTLDEANL